MSYFHLAVIHIFKVEGGYVDNKNDKGGATKFGITQRTLDNYREESDNPGFPLNVSCLERYQAKEIYFVKYWSPLNLDKIESQEVAQLIFDQSVNVGVRRAAKRTQLALNSSQRYLKLKIDGLLGRNSIRELNRVPPNLFCKNFFILTQIFYAKIVRDNPSQAVFILGWIKRSHTLLDLFR